MHLKKIEKIPFSDWHPEISDNLWERLSFGTRWYKFKDRGLDTKDHISADGNDDISYRDVLTYFLGQYGVAFTIEHYLLEQGIRNPRILEIGSWPMRNSVVSAQFGTTLLAILGQNESYTVVGVDNVDRETVFPYKAWTPPYFGNGKMVYGDINHKETREKLTEKLGGLPQIIVGNMVFEKRMGAWCMNERNRSVYLRTGFPLPTNLPTRDYVYVAENLAKTCNSYLDSTGVMFVCNRGYGEIPDSVSQMPLLRIYSDEKGKELVQVRAKLTE